MRSIDAVIEDKPTSKMVKDLVELRNRNILAFEELQSLNDTGKFRYKHPLIVNFSLQATISELKQKSPDQFLEEYSNCRENVKRYSSYLKNKNRSEGQKAKDRENLKKHQAKEAVFKEVMRNE